MDGGETGSKVLKDFKGNKSKFFEGSIEMQERIKKKEICGLLLLSHFSHVRLCVTP